VAGRKVRVGSAAFVGQDALLPDPRRLTEQGRTTVFVAVDGEVVGVLAIADPIRASSREAVARLRAMGLDADCHDLNFDAAPVRRVPGGGLARDEYEIAATIDRADAMQLTLLDRAFPGDTEFPAYESKVGKVWRETIRERGSWWDFVDYERIR